MLLRQINIILQKVMIIKNKNYEYLRASLIIIGLSFHVKR